MARKGGRGTKGKSFKSPRSPREPKTPIAYNPEDERLSDLKREFMADWKADEPFRRDKLIYGDFYDGDQWEQDEIAELKERGQPVIVNNRIKPKIDAIIGITAEARVDTKAYAKGDRKREEDVSEISEEFRAIEDDSNFDQQELSVFKDVLIDGRGWYQTGRQWDGLKYRLKTQHVENDKIVPDRFGTKPDLSDHTRVHETDWKSLEDAKLLFPGFEQELEDAVNTPVPIDEKKGAVHHTNHASDQYGGPGADASPHYLNDFVDKPQKRVRIVTTWYRAPYVRRFLMTPGQAGGVTDITDFDEDGLKNLKLMFPGSKEWKETHKRLNTCTFTWNAILEEKKDIKEKDSEARFNLIMVPGYRKRRTGQHYGLVKQHMDAQREVNKRRSKMLHLLNSTETIFKAGAFENEGRAREEFSQPDAWIRVAGGENVSEQVQRLRHDNLAASQFQLLQESKQEIDSAGVNREIEGRSNATSGREFQYRTKEALKGMREILGNLRDGRKRVAEGPWLDDIIERFPDLAKARYDVVVEEAPDSLTLTQEVFEVLASLAKSGQVQIPADILIEASPLPPKVKNQLLEKLKADEEQRAMLLRAQLQAQGQMSPEGPEGGPPAGNA